jgi:threonine dehydrogenase-like Zn-dependent dehydrogenase
VTVIGKHGWKLDLARSWGIKGTTAGDGQVRDRSFRVVVEASGSPTGLRDALRLVAPRGTVVMKSTFQEKAQFDSSKLVVDEITLLGSRCGSFGGALNLLARGQVKVRPMISQTFPLEAGEEAFAFLKESSCLKVVLAPSCQRRGNR